MAIDPNNLPNLQNLQGDPGYSNPDVYQFAGDAENFAKSQTTTLPFWYNVAGQNLANLAYAQTPESLTQAGQASQNVGQAAAQNQQTYTGTQNTLQNIASGLANPYTASGQLDTSTVPGKLFQSQFDVLNQQLPEITAGQDAAAIAQGGFGGLRNQVASNVARGQAIADLGQRQAQSLLQGQQTGINALQQSGTLGQQNLAGQIAAGQFNVQAPFSPLTNYANVLGQIAQGAPQTTYSSPSYVDIDAAKAQAQAVQRANSIFAKQGGRIGGLNHYADGGSIGDYDSWDDFYDDLDSVKRDRPRLIKANDDRTVLGDFIGGLSRIGDSIGLAEGGSIEDEIEANIIESGNQPYYDPRMKDYMLNLIGNDVDGNMLLDEIEMMMNQINNGDR